MAIIFISVFGSIILSQLALLLESPEDKNERIANNQANEKNQAKDLPQSQSNIKPKNSHEKELSEYRWRRIQTSLMILKGYLRDPESLVIDNIYEASDGSIVCISYRAKNGFGGFSQEFVSINQDGNLSKQAGQCASKKIEFFDYTSKAKYAM